MTAEELKIRTKQFAIRNINLVRSLPKTEEAKIIGRQLLRSVTSVGSNYRAACRARSNDEFYSKISIVVEEADETMFWHELLLEAGIIKEEKLSDLMREANEIIAIMAKARKTIKSKTRHANKS
jgi:four helix bundle protein